MRTCACILTYVWQQWFSSVSDVTFEGWLEEEKRAESDLKSEFLKFYFELVCFWDAVSRRDEEAFIVLTGQLITWIQARIQSLLFLLCYQLYLWVSPFMVRFLCMWPCFNPTIEVVTFHLHGWCMLGVFLLPAFTRLWHECQDLLSPCDGMHVCTDYTSVYTLIQKSFGNGVRTHVISKGKIPSTGGSEQHRTCDAASRRTVSPTH